MQKLSVQGLILLFVITLAGSARGTDTTGVTATSIKIGLFGPITGGGPAGEELYEVEAVAVG
jgi:hypothetical protein